METNDNKTASEVFLNYVWNNDAPRGMAWKCPDCDSWATLGGNAGFHARESGHRVPTLETQPGLETSSDKRSAPDAEHVLQKELLPCPFCGETGLARGYWQDTGCYIRCTSCGVLMPGDDRDSRWNQRAVPSVLDGTDEHLADPLSPESASSPKSESVSTSERWTEQDVILHARNGPRSHPAYHNENIADAHNEDVSRLEQRALDAELFVALHQDAWRVLSEMLKIKCWPIQQPRFVTDEVVALLQRALAAEQDRARLREALEPFVRLANKFDVEPYASQYPNELRLTGNETIAYHNFLTLGDCRKAKSAAAMSLETQGQS